MSKANIKVVHESEAQRQHVRVKISASATIDGKTYAVEDLSVGGMRLRDAEAVLTAGQDFECVLRFPFEGFALQIDVECMVEHSQDEASMLGCVFTTLEASQRSLLNLVIQSHLSGAVVSEDNILQIAGRDNFVKFRKNIGCRCPLQINRVIKR